MASPWFLRDRTFVVTGGSKGIGRAVVDELLALDAKLVIYCSREATTVTTADTNDRLLHVVCDISTSIGRTDLINTCKEHAPIDGLVNNVGVNIRKPILEQTIEEYEMIQSTNIDATYYLCRELYPYLRRNTASIVNVSSAAGIQSSGTGIAYAMSKAAINQLTRTLACEWAPSIRVNAVAPWMTMTPMLQNAAGNDLSNVKNLTPMHRLATPNEIATPICFLLMDASAYMTGQVIAVDGGLTAQGFPGPCANSAP